MKGWLLPEPIILDEVPALVTLIPLVEAEWEPAELAPEEEGVPLVALAPADDAWVADDEA